MQGRGSQTQATMAKRQIVVPRGDTYKGFKAGKVVSR